MPWLFNSTPDVIPAILQDGTSYGFLPRKKVYIDPEKMSSSVWDLVRSRQLINKGGDPVQQAPVVIPHIQVQPLETVTSSSLHLADASFTVDSSNADLEKEVKAEKKQSDDDEKATSDHSEVVTQSNDEKKISKRNRKSRRR